MQKCVPGTVPSHFKNPQNVNVWRPRVSAARLVGSDLVWAKSLVLISDENLWCCFYVFFHSRFCPDIFLLLGSYPDFVESLVPISHVFGQ